MKVKNAPCSTAQPVCLSGSLGLFCPSSDSGGNDGFWIWSFLCVFSTNSKLQFHTSSGRQPACMRQQRHKEICQYVQLASETPSSAKAATTRNLPSSVPSGAPMFKPTSLLAAVGLAGLFLDPHHRHHVDAFAPTRRGGGGGGCVVVAGPPTPSLLSSRASSIFDAATAPPSAASRWPSSRRSTAHRRGVSAGLHMSRLTFVDEVEEETSSSFDPFDLGGGGGWDSAATASRTAAASAPAAPAVLAVSTALLSPFVVGVPPALAAFGAGALSQGDFDPDTFRPVCAASDSFYRLLQSSTRAVVGDDNFSEYGPLIAGGLLRVRLELCVVESFFNEAVGPFVKQNGLNWVLPLHETVETFIAGTIFALATTFILVGSTKLIQIIAFYGDLVLGGPCRLFGGFFFDRARGMPVTLDVSFFGFWKTRLVGPPLDQDESKNGGGSPGGGGESPSSSSFALVDFDKVRPADVPLLALFGAIKVVGETSKVSCASSRLVVISACSARGER